MSTVCFTYPWSIKEGERQIFALVPAVYTGDFELKYFLDASELLLLFAGQRSVQESWDRRGQLG